MSDANDLSAVWPGWRIVDTLGRGAFGEVYKISREEFGHVSYAAAKRIRVARDDNEVNHLVLAGADDSSIRKDLRTTAHEIADEIEVMESLKGASNVVFITDSRLIEEPDHSWTIWIRMELLKSLPSITKPQVGIGVIETVKLGIDMCEALECCHSHGIIHRDVKPENIFRSDFGDYKLGDFGIAKRLESATQSVYSRKGTMTYAAPEVMRGEKYDNRVDIYSLGIVLYRYLNDMRYPLVPASLHPVTKSDIVRSVKLRMRGERLPAPKNADKRLSKIILKACEYDRNKRYATAKDLRKDLIAWMRTNGYDTSIHMRRDTTTGRHARVPDTHRTGSPSVLELITAGRLRKVESKHRRRNARNVPVVPLLVALVTVVCIAFGINQFMAGSQPSSPTQAAETGPNSASEQPAKADSPVDDTTRKEVVTETKEANPDTTPEGKEGDANTLGPQSQAAQQLNGHSENNATEDQAPNTEIVDTGEGQVEVNNGSSTTEERPVTDDGSLDHDALTEGAGYIDSPYGLFPLDQVETITDDQGSPELYMVELNDHVYLWDVDLDPSQYSDSAYYPGPGVLAEDVIE